jgi:hypothetical protein
MSFSNPKTPSMEHQRSEKQITRPNDANNLQYFTTVEYGNPEDPGRPNLVEA